MDDTVFEDECETEALSDRVFVGLLVIELDEDIVCD